MIEELKFLESVIDGYCIKILSMRLFLIVLESIIDGWILSEI